MGCACSLKSVNAYNTSLKGLKHCEEVEELADLPQIAKEEELDLVTLVEISLKCSNLPSIDRFTSVDPIVFLLIEEEGVFRFKDQTEVQHNNLSPSFVTSFKISYSFEKKLRFKLDVYDNKNINSNPPNRNALIGSAVFNIHEVVCAHNHTCIKTLLNPISKKKDNGFISAHSEEVMASNVMIQMTWTLMEVGTKDFYVLRINKKSEGQSIPIFQSESAKIDTKKKSVWESFSISVNKLCKGDMHAEAIAEVFKVNNGLKFIGSTNFRVNQITSGNFEGNLISNGQVSGKLKLVDAKLIEKNTFLEYIVGGCEISLIIGIDFTKSNGPPDEEKSLHYQNREMPNEYIQAILEVGETLQYYNSDKRVPVFGFGAKLAPKYNVTSHCFAINGNIFEPELLGLDEILKSYAAVFSKIQLHGPTCFSEIIKKSCDFASNKELTQDSQQYYILLILTDGIINDLEKTIDEIAVAANLPISIVVVGVGNEDFSMMKVLDADDVPLFSQKFNTEITRDLIQFVPFKEFKGKAHALAREVLFEIPNQLLSFMKARNIRPKISKELIKSNTLSNKTAPLRFKKQEDRTPSVFINDIKENFIREIVESGYRREIAEEIINDGIPCIDVGLAKELIEEKKKSLQPKSILKKKANRTRTLSFRENRKKGFCFLCQIQNINVAFENCECEVICVKCVKSLGLECPLCGASIGKWVIKN